jgi:hypothetical protein
MGETDKDAIESADRRRQYELAVHKIVQRLSPQDFEHLIDLILARTGWERLGRHCDRAIRKKVMLRVDEARDRRCGGFQTIRLAPAIASVGTIRP